MDYDDRRADVSLTVPQPHISTTHFPVIEPTYPPSTMAPLQEEEEEEELEEEEDYAEAGASSIGARRSLTSAPVCASPLPGL